MRRISKVYVHVHPSLFDKMEEVRKIYRDKLGINLSQIQQTGILAKNIKIPKLNKLDLLNGRLNVKRKK